MGLYPLALAEEGAMQGICPLWIFKKVLKSKEEGNYQILVIKLFCAEYCSNQNTYGFDISVFKQISC
jgi:hypothetical protein